MKIRDGTVVQIYPGTPEFEAAMKQWAPIEDRELRDIPLFPTASLVREHVDPHDWIQAAGDALLAVAKSHEEVTSDLIHGELQRRGVPPPHDTHAMGIVVRQGVDRKLIEPIKGKKVSTAQRKHHGGYIQAYRSLVWSRSSAKA